MLKTFKYRIYPNKTETQKLLFILETCRWTYNSLVNLKKESWEKEKISISKFACNNIISKWKKEIDKDFLNDVHSQILQNVSDRVDKTYRNFFKRIKLGEKCGFPRFKSFGNYDSFTYPQSGFFIKNNNQNIKLNGVGFIKLIYHRPIQGKIKTCTIRKTKTNKWYITFSCELDDVLKQSQIKNPIGIDLGLNNFITLSNGQYIATQKFFRKDESKIKKLHQNLSNSKKGTTERKEAKKRLALGYEKINNRKNDFAHKISKLLTVEFDYIVFEDLSIDMMVKNHRLAKSIKDVAWNQLVRYTQYKAESAGTWVKLVDPSYTSQTCSNCGIIKKKSLAERWHNCDCGLSIDRDENAAINILRLGIQSLEVSN